MKENDLSYSWSGKSCSTTALDRCMNDISPFLRLINYIAGLYDTLYTIRGRMKWGNGNNATDVGNQAPPLALPLLTFEKRVV